MNIYEIRSYGTAAFLIISVLVVALFLYYSNKTVRDLAAQERNRMQIWADATKQLSSNAELDDGTIAFLFSIIEANDNIPVLLTDGDVITDQRNFNLPNPEESFAEGENMEYLNNKLARLRGSDNVIEIDVSADKKQYLYYEDSTLLKSLSRYPYIQIVVMIVFVLVVYCAVISTKKAEQNKVWVGLSKETAHQLGTPISSLMAWIELLRQTGVPEDMTDEMDKDVKRLETIASRFSKIGSQPQKEITDINAVVEKSVEYMRLRISSRIHLSESLSQEIMKVAMSAPLIEWVMENLIKNAVDAMEGEGSIKVSTHRDKTMAIINVEDTGKGMTRKMRKAVFKAGFTTKKRGWGLGLTLARRIIEQYHDGKISVSHSEPGVGTTFEIQLPLLDE